MRTATMRNLAIRGEGWAVRAAVRVADRVGGPWARRRRLSPYVLLVAESTEGGADYATATSVARRLVQQHGTPGGPSLRRLQRTARIHARTTRDATTIQGDGTRGDGGG